MMRPGYRSNRFRSKAERPLLLLFPGCCDDATASGMRIRKVQVRGLPGNSGAASERGDSTASAAPADESHLLPAVPAKDSNPDDAPSSRSAALQKRSPTPPDRPYMNLDEFVSSLARKNCFPDEETSHKTGESSGSLINFFDDRSVDTSLRLAIDPEPVRIKGGHVADQPDDGHLQYGSNTTSARIESPLEAGKSTDHLEVFGDSYRTTPILEPEEVEVEEVEGEDGQPEQAMKSSTESMERRPRRTSRSTGRKREWSAEEDQEEDEDESSEHSSQHTKTRKRKRKKREHSSVTQDHTSSEKKAKTKKKPGGSSSRSGRPKKLKYMKQENTEELGNQCNRSDGKGWTCPLLAKTGYQLCDHHLDKLRCKPGSRSKYNKSKKKKQ